MTTHKEVAGQDGKERAEGGLRGSKQTRQTCPLLTGQVSNTCTCTQVSKKSLGEVVDLQGSSPPTSRTTKLVDLNSLEKCIYGNQGQGNPKCGYRQGNECIENSPVGKDLGVLVDKTLSRITQYVLAAQKDNHIQLHQKKCEQQVLRGVSPCLFCSDETPPGHCYSFSVRVVKGRMEFDVTQIY